MFLVQWLILKPFKWKRLQAAYFLLPLKMETLLGIYIFRLQIKTDVLRN